MPQNTRRAIAVPHVAPSNGGHASRIFGSLAAGCAALVLGLAAPADARTKAIPAATPAGKPVDCLQISQLRASHVRSDDIIDFETAGGKVYRNTLPNSCPSLGFEERFSYTTSLSQLCSVDVITVLQSPPMMRGATCGLGKFQPVTLAKPGRK